MFLPNDPIVFPVCICEGLEITLKITLKMQKTKIIKVKTEPEKGRGKTEQEGSRKNEGRKL